MKIISPNSITLKLKTILSMTLNILTERLVIDLPYSSKSPLFTTCLQMSWITIRDKLLTVTVSLTIKYKKVNLFVTLGHRFIVWRGSGETQKIWLGAAVHVKANNSTTVCQKTIFKYCPPEEQVIVMWHKTASGHSPYCY